MISACGLQGEDTPFYHLENKLDSENLNLLNSLINKMEEHLELTYGPGDLTDIYGSYFLNTSLGDSHLEITESECIILSLFEESELSEKYLTVNYDTVYANGDLLISVIDNDTTFEIISGISIVPKLVEKQMAEGFQMLIEKGKLYEVLMSIEKKDEMLFQYLSRKEATGNVNPKEMASYFAENQIDVSKNYILKALVLNEIYMSELKRHGC